MKHKPGRKPTGIDISPLLDAWLKASCITRKDFARRCDIPYSTLNSYATGKLLAKNCAIDKIVAALGIEHQVFFDGAPPQEVIDDAPLIEHIPPALRDDPDDGIAMRLFKALCRKCPKYPRGCDTCQTKRYVQLCICAVGEKISAAAAIKDAENITESCIADANARHDAMTFMSAGHAGGK